MRTRKAETVRPATTPKNASPAVKKSAGTMQKTPSSAGVRAEASPAEISEPKRASSGRTKILEPKDDSPTSIPQSSVEMATSSPEAAQLTKFAKLVPKVVKKVVKKVTKKKIPVSAMDTSGRVLEIRADEAAIIEETLKEKALEGSNIVESVGHEPTTDESPLVGNIQGSAGENKNSSNAGKHFNKEDRVGERQKHLMQSTGNLSDFAEPSRSRPRLDYSDPAIPNRGTRYQDDLAADGSFLPQNYYGSWYGGGAYSAFNRADHPYGRDYYY